MEFVPWTLILHRKEYPKDNILSIVDKSTIKDYWLNQIKEVRKECWRFLRFLRFCQNNLFR